MEENNKENKKENGKDNMNSNIIHKKFKLEGITCSACESKIEDKLNQLKGVYEVEVSYVTSNLIITYDGSKISKEDIIEVIENLDYQVLYDFSEILGEITPMEKDKGKKAKNKQNELKDNIHNSRNINEKSTNDNQKLFFIGIIMFATYIIIKNTIGFNYIPQIDPNMGYGILFLVGMLTSLHCVAMCGGINLSVCVSYKVDPQEGGKFVKLIPSILYNAGRVVSYTVIGGIVGAIGSVFRISNSGSAFITIFAGAFMIIMGLNMLNIFPWLRKLNPRIPKVFAKKINSKKNKKGPFVVGLLNGLMPCGPLQAMQLYALGTGSFIAGALSMFLFSLGTVPLLFLFGALGSILSSKFTKDMIKVSAMLVVVLGIAMINRGVAFTGFTYDSFVTVKNEDLENTSIINKDVQEINTNLESGSYAPITVQAGIPVKWTITAKEGSLNGCNNEIIIPKYNISKKLVEGENVITFTPTDTGKFGYSCWMGMIRSSISVVSNIQNTNETKEVENSSEVDDSGIPSGCCGY